MARRRRSKIGDFATSQIPTDRKPLDIAAASALVPAGLDREVLLQMMLMTRLGALSLQLDEIAVFPLTRGAGDKMAQQHERKKTGLVGLDHAGAGMIHVPVFEAWDPPMDGSQFLGAAAGVMPGIRLYHNKLGGGTDEWIYIDENDNVSVEVNPPHAATLTLSGVNTISRATGQLDIGCNAGGPNLSTPDASWEVSACIIEGVDHPESVRLNGINKNSAVDASVNPDSDYAAPMYGMSSEISWDEAKKLVYIEPTTDPLIDQTFTSQAFVLPAPMTTAEEICVAVLVDPAHYAKDFLAIEAVTDPNFHQGLQSDGTGTYGSNQIWTLENRTTVPHNASITDFQGNTLLYVYGKLAVWCNGVGPAASESLMLRFTLAGQKGGAVSLDTLIAGSAAVGAHTYATIDTNVFVAPANSPQVIDRDITLEIHGGLLPGSIKIANPLTAPVFTIASGFAGMVIDSAASVAASTMKESRLMIDLVFTTHANVTGGSNWLITYYGIPRELPCVIAGFGVGIK